MADTDFLFAKAKRGDVCNRQGDIRVIDETGSADIASFGNFLVTRKQADFARVYGWAERSSFSDGMVMIERWTPRSMPI